MRRKMLLVCVIAMFVAVNIFAMSACVTSGKQYTVNFDLNGGEGTLAPQSYAEGAKLADLPVPTRQGYVFQGWQDADGQAYNAQSVMPARDLTLIAQWKADEVPVTRYTVTFNGNGMQEAPQSQSYAEGDLMSDLPFAERDGYAFLGWQTTDGTIYNKQSKMPASDIALIAQWKQSNIQYEVVDGAAIVTGYSGGTEVVIPEIVDGYPVTEVDSMAFENNAEITDVVIGNRIDWIGDFAFAGTSITSVHLPSSLSGLRGKAFARCSNLQTITVDPSNTYFEVKNHCLIERSTHLLVTGTNQSEIPTDDSVTKIGPYAFSGRSFGNLTVPGNIKSIGYCAFNGCALQDVVLAEGVKSIGSNAFDKSTLRTIDIPNTVTEIGIFAFSKCTELTELDIPDSVRSIGRFLCQGSTSLRSVTLGKGLEVIGSGAFEETDVQSIVIPDNIVSIGTGAFEDCSQLKEVKIGTGVRWIGNFAFSGAKQIAQVHVPLNVCGIGVMAFESDVKISCDVAQKPAGWDTRWNNNGKTTWGQSDLQSGDYRYMVRDNAVYLTQYNGTGGVVNIPAEIEGKPVVSIGSVFAGNTTITDVTIPDSVTMIGGRAFYQCTALKRIKIGNNVTDIMDNAFWECSALTDVILGENLVSIQDYAFYKCISLEQITIPASVRFVGQHAFDMNKKGKFTMMVFQNTQGWHLYQIEDKRKDIDVTDPSENAKNFGAPKGTLLKPTWWGLNPTSECLMRE